MKLFRIFLLALAFVSLQAAARTPVPVVNIEDVPVSAISGKPLDLAQVRQAIDYGANVRQWTLAESSPGVLLASLNVRNKHTVVVEIRYSAEKYSLLYRDSQNMNAEEKNGQRLIHPYYNRWVKDLNESIRAALPRA